MSVLHVLQIAFVIGLIFEAYKGKQKVFARAALSFWFSINILFQFGIDEDIINYPLFIAGLTLGIWMYSLKIKYFLQNQNKNKN